MTSDAEARLRRGFSMANGGCGEFTGTHSIESSENELAFSSCPTGSLSLGVATQASEKAIVPLLQILQKIFHIRVDNEHQFTEGLQGAIFSFFCFPIFLALSKGYLSLFVLVVFLWICILHCLKLLRNQIYAFSKAMHAPCNIM